MDGMREILDFWLEEETKPLWFASTPQFDQAIRARFGATFERAVAGELKSWEDSSEGCLALCLLFDQMPRNMFRGTPAAYASDQKAREVAERAVERGFDRDLPLEQKQFLYLPFSHSERLADQRRAVQLFEAAGFDEETLGYVRGHLSIIRRFGRFPHRNAILGRTSTPEEIAFLAERPDHYGQGVAERSDQAQRE